MSNTDYIPTRRPIPEYPPLSDERDWAKLLRYAQAMLERLGTRQEPPDSDEIFQAIVHLFQTLAPGHYRRLH